MVYKGWAECPQFPDEGVDTCEILETQPESGWNEKDREEFKEEMWISEV